MNARTKRTVGKVLSPLHIDLLKRFVLLGQLSPIDGMGPRQIGLDQASISDSRALGGSTLTIGKQLSPKFFVSYGVSLFGETMAVSL